MSFICEAEARIREDYLRILRFFSLLRPVLLRAGSTKKAFQPRSGCAMGFGSAIAQARARRTCKTAHGNRSPAGSCRRWARNGFLEPVLGGVAYTRRLSRLIAIEAGRGVGGDALLRLAALGIAIPEDAERLHDRLRTINAESDQFPPPPATLICLPGHKKPSFNGLRTNNSPLNAPPRATLSQLLSPRQKRHRTSRASARHISFSPTPPGLSSTIRRADPNRASHCGGTAGWLGKRSAAFRRNGSTPASPRSQAYASPLAGGAQWRHWRRQARAGRAYGTALQRACTITELLERAQEYILMRWIWRTLPNPARKTYAYSLDDLFPTMTLARARIAASRYATVGATTLQRLGD